jgi:hypothetical protein
LECLVAIPDAEDALQPDNAPDPRGEGYIVDVSAIPRLSRAERRAGGKPHPVTHYASGQTFCFALRQHIAGQLDPIEAQLARLCGDWYGHSGTPFGGKYESQAPKRMLGSCRRLKSVKIHFVHRIFAFAA